MNLLAKKLKKGGFLETMSTKMGIDVKETSPFVDFSKQTTKEMKEGMTSQEIEDYRLKYLAKNFKISGRKGVSVRLYDPAGYIPSNLRLYGRQGKS